jgi:hypothetical protein
LINSPPRRCSFVVTFQSYFELINSRRRQTTPTTPPPQQGREILATMNLLEDHQELPSSLERRVSRSRLMIDSWSDILTCSMGLELPTSPKDTDHRGDLRMMPYSKEAFDKLTNHIFGTIALLHHTLQPQ